MNTSHIYEEMHSRNLTASKRSWSEHWLGRAHNFASIHWKHPMPAETLLHLRERLIQAGHHDLAAKLLLVLLGEFPDQQGGQTCTGRGSA